MTYRIYFNRRDPKGCMWSVDEGTMASEIHVQRLEFVGVDALSKCNANAAEGEPSGWLEVRNVRMSFFQGAAIFKFFRETDGG